MKKKHTPPRAASYSAVKSVSVNQATGPGATLPEQSAIPLLEVVDKALVNPSPWPHFQFKALSQLLFTLLSVHKALDPIKACLHYSAVSSPELLLFSGGRALSYCHKKHPAINRVSCPHQCFCH